MAPRRTLSLSLVLACSLASCSKPDKPELSPAQSDAAMPGAGIEHRAQYPDATAAYRWVDIMLEVTGREVDKVGARPTIISRQMAIPMTAMYDAWAAYDAKAVGTRLGDKLRRPIKEHTLENKQLAISWAVYLTLVDLFPADREWLAGQMRAMGHDPNDTTTDVATPQGIGRAAAQAVLAHRKTDGANQDGTAQGGDGQAYGDYTGYQPKNPVDRIVDPDRWQPIAFEDGKGGTFVPGFLTPHWYRVKPFALERSDQFRPGPPPLVGSAQLKRDVDENIAMNGSLTLEQKALVEFMRDGPRSTGQSGHWLQFAQDVSRRDRQDLDQDVKLFFAVANVAFDAFIAAWDAKRAYDSSRPFTLVHHYYADETIVGYLGPCLGVGEMKGKDWYPYSPRAFVTPPFPGYVSGHSAVSGASSKMLELFTGSDQFGAYAKHRAGVYTEADCTADRMQAKDGTPDAKAGTLDIVLDLPTFSAVAEIAGLSRVLGGYHIQSDNVEGLALGRKVAEYSWTKYQAYWDGSAPIPTATTP